MTSDEHELMLKCHAEITGGEPLAEQLAALKLRVVDQGGEPYADFAVLTPYGKRLQATLRTRSWVPQGDGTFKAVLVPGPPNFEIWHSERLCFIYVTQLAVLERSRACSGAS